MNMDRFERGPREILNPEIQKVRLTARPRPALIMKPSVQPLISGSPLHSQAGSPLPGVQLVVVNANGDVVLSPQDLLVLEEQEVTFTISDHSLVLSSCQLFWW